MGLSLTLPKSLGCIVIFYSICPLLFTYTHSLLPSGFSKQAAVNENHESSPEKNHEPSQEDEDEEEEGEEVTTPTKIKELKVS